MLISHKQKFIFVHIYKTAGTSIRTTLLNKTSSTQNKKIPSHSNIREIKKQHPNEFTNYFKFAFVRNPWDQHVSLYHHVMKRPKHVQRPHVSKIGFDGFIEWRCAPYPKEVFHEGGFTEPPQFADIRGYVIKEQNKFLVDIKGNIIVDFVGKFENLNDDFAHVCENIGIPIVKLRQLNKSDRKNTSYREFYNDKTRNLIAETFKKDIKMFDYEF